MSFAIGERVRTQAEPRPGHHRLPAYVAGLAGDVVAVRGRFPLPDDIVAGRPLEDRQLCSVRFSARDLWGAGGHTVHLDLYEDYLRKDTST